jgi:hypothetical protein
MMAGMRFSTLVPALAFPALVALASLTGGCGSGTPAPATASADPASAPAPDPAAASAPTPAPAAEEAPAKHYRALDLTSACGHEVHLHYGAHPGDGTGENATVATGATIPVPRQADGTNVVWVTDEQGNGLAHVTITKNMRHIRISADCSKIDADSER